MREKGREFWQLEHVSDTTVLGSCGLALPAPGEELKCGLLDQ